MLSVNGAKGPYPALKLSDRTVIRQGEAVGVCGFHETGSSYRFGRKEMISSLLTTGVVSSYFTIEVNGKNVGSRLVLDVTAGQGSSGSSVFLLDTGEVCGILTQAKLRNVVGGGRDDDSETCVPLLRNTAAFCRVSFPDKHNALLALC